MSELIHATTLLLILLNPFLVIIYLLDLVRDLNQRTFNMVLVRAGLIAVLIFVTFALLGDAIFTKFLHAEFASFQIFGGLVFLIVGIKFMLRGNEALEALRGPAEHLAGAIAMPILVGPASVSASVIIGNTLPPLLAILGIIIAVGVCTVVIILLKMLHDWVKPRHESLVQRYIEIAGRVMAIIVGTYAVEMIMIGVTTWVERIAGVVG